MVLVLIIRELSYFYTHSMLIYNTLSYYLVAEWLYVGLGGVRAKKSGM